MINTISKVNKVYEINKNKSNHKNHYNRKQPITDGFQELLNAEIDKLDKGERNGK